MQSLTHIDLNEIVVWFSQRNDNEECFFGWEFEYSSECMKYTVQYAANPQAKIYSGQWGWKRGWVGAEPLCCVLKVGLEFAPSPTLLPRPSAVGAIQNVCPPSPTFPEWSIGQQNLILIFFFFPSSGGLTMSNCPVDNVQSPLRLAEEGSKVGLLLAGQTGIAGQPLINISLDKLSLHSKKNLRFNVDSTLVMP